MKEHHKMTKSCVKNKILKNPIYLLTASSVIFSITVFLNWSNLINESDKCECSHVYDRQQSFPVEKNGKLGQHKLAILVPYRERFEELLIFAPYMHNFLNKQRINFDIFILNQVDFYRFNRASLINVGFLQIRNNYDYIAMHDVDLLPLNDNLSYSYPVQPFHLAAPELHPRYHYEKFIGGILLINREHFEQVNGLSNRYWGWGLEDDEFYVRLKDVHLNVTRPTDITTTTNNTFRHIHGKHRKRDSTKCFNQREVTRRRDRQTGLHDVKYNVLSKHSLVVDSATVTVFNIQLICNLTATPWCDCSPQKTVKT